MASSIRTFVAIELSAELKSTVEQLLKQAYRTSDDYRWSDSEQLHLTLNFLGDVRDREIPTICSRLKAEVEKHRSFEFSLRGLGAFPRFDRPRVVWAGVGEGETQLETLQAGLEQVLRELRFYPDKPRYKAHLTLGRLRRDRPADPKVREWIQENVDREIGQCWVNEVIVFSSFLDRMGATYTPMARLPLS